MNNLMVNSFLMEIELSFNQSEKLSILWSTFLDNVRESFKNIDHNSIDISMNDTSFKLVVNGQVESENNAILNQTFKCLEKNKDFFSTSIENERDLDLSIYIWSSKASDTPQINLCNNILKLLGTIDINLSVIIYTYDPD